MKQMTKMTEEMATVVFYSFTVVFGLHIHSFPTSLVTANTEMLKRGGNTPGTEQVQCLHLHT